MSGQAGQHHCPQNIKIVSQAKQKQALTSQIRKTGRMGPALHGSTRGIARSLWVNGAFCAARAIQLLHANLDGMLIVQKTLSLLPSPKLGDQCSLLGGGRVGEFVYASGACRQLGL